MDMLELRSRFPQYDDLSNGDLLMGLHKKYYSDMHPTAFLRQIGLENEKSTIETMRPYFLERAGKPMPGESEEDFAKRQGGSASGPVDRDPGGRVMSGARSLLQGGTLGAGDEIVAGVSSIIPGRGTYEEELAKERERLATGRKEYPVQSALTEIGGAMALPGVGVTGTGSRLANAGKGLAIGATEGATYSFLSGEGGFEDRLENALTGAVVGGGIGALSRPLMDAARAGLDNAAVSRALNKVARKLNISPDDLQAEAQRIYRAAEQEAPIPQSAFAQKLDDVTQSSRPVQALALKSKPKDGGMLSTLQDAATDPALANRGMPYGKLQALREVTQDLPSTASKTATSAAMSLREGIDELVEGMGAAGPMVKQANEMWRRMMRHSDVEKAVEKARNAASGFENGLRIEFRKILNDPKKMRGFNDTEKAIIRLLVEGTPISNILRKIGKLGAGTGAQHNVKGALMGGAAGGALGNILGGPMGGLVGAFGVPLVGTVADDLSTALSEKQAKNLMQILLSGKGLPQTAASGPTQFLTDAATAGATRAPMGLMDMFGD